MSEQVEQVTPAMLRDELNALHAFMQTTTYSSFLGGISGSYDDAIEKTLDLAPQTVGEVVEREQSIGEARAFRVAKTFFTEYKERLAAQLVEAESPKQPIPVETYES